MNIECQSCHAKYAVPDDKVLGRKVKIACKKCKAPIIVDGTVAATASQRPRQNTMLGVAPSAGGGSPSAAADAKTSEAWTVAVTDDQHEQMTLDQIVSAYSSEKVDADTFVWREGMSDWVGPFEVPEIAAALSARGFEEPPRVPEADLSSDPTESELAPGGRVAEDDDELPTMVAGAGDFANMMGTRKPGGAAPQVTPSLPPAKPSAAFARLPSTPSPSAARAAKGDSLSFDLAEPPAARAKGGTDLFARAASAGSEAESHAQPSIKAPAHSGLTGARNENSVLFSLDALVSPTQPQPRSDDVNMDDLLSMPSTDDAAPSSIANLTAGNFMLGSSGPLIQPDAPMIPEPAPARAEPTFTSAPPPGRTVSTPPRRGGSVFGVIGGLLFLGVLGYLGYSFLETGSLVPREVAALLGQLPPEAGPAAPEVVPAAPATAAPEASAAPVGELAAAGGTAPLAGAKAPTVTIPAGPTPTPLTGTQGGTATPPNSVPSPTPVSPTPTPLPTPATPAATAKPAESAPSALPPFDVNEAKSALAAAAATASASCKQPNGPTGDGPVQVTFNPSGRATNALVGGAFKGTVVGGCIARIFRTARVSKFSGEQRTVSKTVRIK